MSLIRTLFAIAFLVSWISSAQAAEAHQLNIFASVDGGQIRGKVYFRGNIPAQFANVTAYDPEGKVISSTTSDSLGEFALRIVKQCDYRLVANAGEGHGAETTVPVYQIAGDTSGSGDPGSSDTGSGEPSGVPTGTSAGAAAGAGTPGTKGTSNADHSSSAREVSDRAVLDRELKESVKALQNEVESLRELLIVQQNARRITDVLGGIGYIVGIGGVAFYFYGRRRKKPTDLGKLVGRTRWQ